MAALIGTWLGSVFTLIGLLAVFTQLQALIDDYSVDSEKRVREAAGAWAPCLDTLRRSDTGVVEGKASPLAPWIRLYYGSGKDIDITPYERKAAGGQASWSRLFSRLQVRPQELTSFKRLPSSHGALDAIASQTDILVNGAKISYGFRGDEFAALLILSGFSPSKFHAGDTSSCTGHLGHMYLGPRDPFSQIAQLDGSLNLLPDLHAEMLGRYVHQVNVRRCIDLALGIFRFDCLGLPQTVVLATDDVSSGPEWNAQHNIHWTLERRFAKPSPERLLAVRRNLTHLTGGDVSQNFLYDLTRTSHFDFLETFHKMQAWKVPFGLAPPRENNFLIGMAVAVVLAGLQPWGLPVVVPRSLVDTLCPLLHTALPDVSAGGTMLIRKLTEVPRTIRLDIPGWTWASLEEALDGLQSVSSQHFSGLSSRCSLYYDTMVFLFRLNQIEMHSVSIGVAARCSVALPGPILDEQPHAWESQYRAAIRERLSGEPMDEAPEWAMEILATYLHAWLMDSHPIKEGFRTIFRRRVFLG